MRYFYAGDEISLCKSLRDEIFLCKRWDTVVLCRKREIFIQKMGFFKEMRYFYVRDEIFLRNRWDIFMQEMTFFYAREEIFLCKRWDIWIRMRYFSAREEIFLCRKWDIVCTGWDISKQDMIYVYGFYAGDEIFYARDEKTSFGHARRGGRLQIVMPNIVCVRLHRKEGQISWRLNRMLWKLYNTLGAVILARPYTVANL